MGLQWWTCTIELWHYIAGLRNASKTSEIWAEDPNTQSVRLNDSLQYNIQSAEATVIVIVIGKVIVLESELVAEIVIVMIIVLKIVRQVGQTYNFCRKDFFEKQQL